MVRWDSPLITLLWLEEDIPGDQIWEAAMKGNVKPPNAGTLSVRSHIPFTRPEYLKNDRNTGGQVTYGRSSHSRTDNNINSFCHTGLTSRF